ncbi:MAG: FKBP-type peptidyl-prolyl cis-trans isomerase [Cyclobacteriaceae bacterium]
MKKSLLKVPIGFLAALPFIVASCMISDKEDFPDFNEQLAKDIAAIDSYLAANNITAIEDASGIRYVILIDSIGGKKPTIDSCVTANYQGLLISDEQEFDSGENVSFPLNGVIHGWRIGIPLLNVGDSATLYIPSGYAYGPVGIGDVPGNANLIFNVGLTKVGTTYKPSDRSCN